MARLHRVCPAGIPQHLIQRGNNRQVCFTSTTDFAVYASWLAESALLHGVDVHAWVFMPNHVHLLVTPQEGGGISRMMQYLGRRYVPYFNQQQQRTGTLWEGRYKSCLVDRENYFLVCQRYIEMNPVRAGMVDTPDAYHWSSYQHSGLGHPSTLWAPHPLYLALGNDSKQRAERYRQFVQENIDDESMQLIRSSVNTGMALGNAEFKRKMEIKTGRRQELLKPGP